MVRKSSHKSLPFVVWIIDILVFWKLAVFKSIVDVDCNGFHVSQCELLKMHPLFLVALVVDA